MISSARPLFLACVVALVATGCGPPKVTVKGRLTKGGQPYHATERGTITVTFEPASSAGETRVIPYEAFVNRDGTFELLGRYGKGIPTGTYAIHVREGVPRRLRKKAGFDIHTTREIHGKRNVELEIDIDKPDG